MRHDWLRQHFPFHGVTETVDAPMVLEPPPLTPIAEEGADAHSPRPRRLQRRALEEEPEGGEELLPAEMIAYATARDGNPGAAAKGLNKRVRGELTPLQEEDAPEGSSANAGRNEPRRSSRRTTKAARRG